MPDTQRFFEVPHTGMRKLVVLCDTERHVVADALTAWRWRLFSQGRINEQERQEAAFRHTREVYKAEYR